MKITHQLMTIAAIITLVFEIDETLTKQTQSLFGQDFLNKRLQNFGKGG